MAKISFSRKVLSNQTNPLRLLGLIALTVLNAIFKKKRKHRTKIEKEYKGNKLSLSLLTSVVHFELYSRRKKQKAMFLVNTLSQILNNNWQIFFCQRSTLITFVEKIDAMFEKYFMNAMLFYTQPFEAVLWGKLSFVKLANPLNN